MFYLKHETFSECNWRSSLINSIAVMIPINVVLLVLLANVVDIEATDGIPDAYVTGYMDLDLGRANDSAGLLSNIIMPIVYNH